MRLDQLTFIRFIAATCVIIYHFGTTLFPYNIEPFNKIANNANVAVSFFFILSGFVMIVAYGNKSYIKPSEFYRNRLTRIYPA